MECKADSIDDDEIDDENKHVVLNVPIGKSCRSII